MSNQIADKELTAELNEYNYYVGQRQALERLEQNPDFQSVILDGYLNREAVRGVGLLANYTIKSQGRRADVMEGLVAISTLNDYFLTIKKMAPSEDEMFDDESDEG